MKVGKMPKGQAEELAKKIIRLIHEELPDTGISIKSLEAALKIVKKRYMNACLRLETPDFKPYRIRDLGYILEAPEGRDTEDQTGKETGAGGGVGTIPRCGESKEGKA